MTTTNEQRSLSDQDYLNLSVIAYMDVKTTVTQRQSSFNDLANNYLLKDESGNYIKDSEGNYQLGVEVNTGDSCQCDPAFTNAMA